MCVILTTVLVDLFLPAAEQGQEEWGYIWVSPRQPVWEPAVNQSPSVISSRPNVIWSVCPALKREMGGLVLPSPPTGGLFRGCAWGWPPSLGCQTKAYLVCSPSTITASFSISSSHRPSTSPFCNFSLQSHPPSTATLFNHRPTS